MTTSTLNTRRSAWERTGRRQRALAALTDAISHDATDLSAAVRHALDEGFDSLDDLLLDAHAQWVRAFDARIDGLLELGAYGDQGAFDAVWNETARLLRGTALLLDRYADHPAIVRAHALHARRAKLMLAIDLPSTFAPLPTRRRQPRRRGLARFAHLRIA